jgi:hypothetical protein
MRLLLLKFSASLLLCSLCACQSTRRPESASPSTAPVLSEKQGSNLQTRDNALALLDDLLGDEKNLSKILIIKHNSDEFGKLVKDISKTAGDSAKMVEALAKTQPGLNLKSTDLPPGEAATRKAISKTKEQLLLHSKDAEFEFQLLLTQVEALNYGAHLAMVVADSETDANGTREFLRLAAQLRDLRERVEAMLRQTRGRG